MKKRFLSLLCVLALCLSLLPATVLAIEPNEIPDGMTIKGTVVTKYEGNATSVTVPEGVTEIGSYAFLSSTVQEVTLPSTLTTIGEYAFQNSTLTSITIPESVTNIGKYAFTQTDELVRATIQGNPTLGEGVFWSSGIQNIEMDRVTAISYLCFARSSLTSISMDSVKTIGESAFKSTNLTEFTVPDTVESIGPYFLDDIEDLVTLKVSLATLQKTVIHTNAFANISSGCDVVLTDVNTDITLVEGGFSVEDETYTFLRFSITTVLEPSNCTITNQTGGDVSIVVDGETITLANGNVKPVGDAANADAYLADLTVTAGSSTLALTPSFSNPVTGYTASVGNDITSVSVTAHPSNSSAVVDINGQTATPDNSYTVDEELVVGENPIFIVVTAPDGTTLKTYTVTVTRNEVVPQHLTISTADELMDFASKINGGTYVVDATADMVVELTANIDMSGYDWIPIGNSDTQFFAGTFDGNNHTISNLNMSNDSECGYYLGLFGMTMATIRDVHVSGKFVDKTDGISDYWFGSIAGCTGGDVTGCTAEFTVYGENDELQGQIIGGIVGYGDNADLENCVSSTSVSGYAGGYLGGIAGYTDTCELVNCRNEGSFNITGTSGQTFIGGIAGQICGSSTLDHCVNNGNIAQMSTNLSGVTVGGICGYMYPTGDSCTCQITNCTNNGSVETQARYAAGIVGRAGFGYGICTIKSCLNNGAISSSHTSSNITSGVSGLTSYCPNPGSLTACISLGSLSATDPSVLVHPVAAVTSVKDGFDISSNYYDSSLATQGNIAQAVTDGSTGKLLTELETEAFIQQINSEGGNFRLDENGHIEVIPLSYTSPWWTATPTSPVPVRTRRANRSPSTPAPDLATALPAGPPLPGPLPTPLPLAPPSPCLMRPPPSPPLGAAVPDDPDPSYSIKLDVGDHGSVHTSHRTAEEGETVTLTVTPDGGYVLKDLTVTDSNGKAVKLASKGGDRYTFKMPARSVTVTAVFIRDGIQKLPFTDVAEHAWYADAAAYVYEHGLMAGTSATTFAPDVTTSRAMIATILWRMAGSPVVNYAMDFADVASGPVVLRGHPLGGQRGHCGRLRQRPVRDQRPHHPGAVCRHAVPASPRRGAMTMSSAGENTNILSYTDVADVAEYAIPAMQWACGAGIISGTGDGSTLTPQGQATRAQAAVMLTRFCEEYVTW